MQPDRWNPRVWLRDWLEKPTPSELARREAIENWTQSVVDRIRSDDVSDVASDGSFKPTGDAELRPSDPLQTSHRQSLEKR